MLLCCCREAAASPYADRGDAASLWTGLSRGLNQRRTTMTLTSPIWTVVAIVLAAGGLYTFICLINYIASLIPSHEMSMSRLQTYIRNLEGMDQLDKWAYARHGVRQKRK